MTNQNDKAHARQQWLFAILVIAFLWVVYTHLAEIRKLAQVLQQGKLVWVFVAAVLQAGYFVAYSFIYHYALATVEVSSRVRELLPLTFASVFIDSTAPSGGVAGTALFVDAAHRQGQSAARAAAGTILVLIALYGVFAFILTGGLLYLLQQGGLTTLQIISAVLLFLLVGGMISVLLLGAWQPSWLIRLLSGIQKLINWFGGLVKRPSLLPPDWAQRHAADFAAAGSAIRAHPTRLSYTVAAAVIAHVLNIASLGSLFLAFNIPLNWPVVAASYAMTLLFWIVSPTPNGVGIVETVMPLVYVSLGVAPEAGTVINLAFRGLSFWLPLLIGFISLRRLRLFDAPEAEMSRRGQVRLVAILIGFIGLLNVLTAVSSTLVARLETINQFLPLVVVGGGHLTAVLSGFALLLLAPGLWHYQRLAWRLLLVTLLVSALAHILKGYDYADTFLSLLLAGYLWTQRAHFPVSAAPPSLVRGIGSLLAAAAFTLSYSTTGIYLLGEWSEQEPTLRQSWQETVNLLLKGFNASPISSTTVGTYFAASVYVVAGVTACFAFGLLLYNLLLLVRKPSIQS